MARRMFVVVFCMVMVCMLVACGTSTGKTQATNQGTPQAGSSSVGPPNAAGVGDTVTLTWQRAALDVTLIKVVDPTKRFHIDIPKGKKCVGVLLHFANTGDAPYYEHYGVGFGLADSSGSWDFRAGYGWKDLQPGETSESWASFIVSKGFEPAAFRFSTAQFAIAP